MNNVEKINKLIGREYSVSIDEVNPDWLLVDDLGCDSLDVVELVMGIEEVFEIEIPDGNFEEWKTVGDIYNYVNGVVK